MIPKHTARLLVGVCLLLAASTVFAETAVSVWGGKSAPLGSVYLSSPTTLATDGHGNLLITDLGNSRIVAVHDWEFFGTVKPIVMGTIGHLGSWPGQLNLPFGVAIDRQGNILVADTGNHRIQKLNRFGFPLSRWGSQGSGPGEFELPREIAVDSANRYFVTDEFNNRVQVFSHTGVFLFQFGGYGSGPGQFRLPQGIAIDSQDRVFVADTFNHRIQVFDAAGNYQSQIGVTGAAGDGPTVFYYPRGVAVDEHDALFVADTFNHKIKKFDADLAYQYSVGASPRPSYPNSIRPMGDGVFYVTDTGNNQVLRYQDNGDGAELTAAVGLPRTEGAQFNAPTSIDLAQDGRMYVVDKFNHRVQVLNPNGQVLDMWGKNGGNGGSENSGALPGEFNTPGQLTVDSQGRVFVADSLNSRVQVFGADGEYLATIGGFGFIGGTFILPTGVSVDANGNVFVLDFYFNRVQKFDADFNFLGMWGSAGLGDGQFRSPTELDVDAAGTVYVVDRYNGRMQKFDNDGNFVTKWGSNDGNPNPDILLNHTRADGDLYLPTGVRVAGNTVYVSDGSNNRVQKFDLSGNYIGQWGSFGGGDNEMFAPNGIAIDAAGDVYVTDLLLHRVVKYTP